MWKDGGRPAAAAAKPRVRFGPRKALKASIRAGPPPSAWRGAPRIVVCVCVCVCARARARVFAYASPPTGAGQLTALIHGIQAVIPLSLYRSRRCRRGAVSGGGERSLVEGSGARWR